MLEFVVPVAKRLALLLTNEVLKSVINVFGNIGAGAGLCELAKEVESKGEAAAGINGGKGAAEFGKKVELVKKQPAFEAEFC